MANNRMYIVCSRCVMDGKDAALYLGKYFPREGWYRNDPIPHEVYNKFLEDHSHEEARTLFGYDPSYGFPFSLYFEAGNRSQDKILMAIGDALSKENNEEQRTETIRQEEVPIDSDEDGARKS